MMPMEAPAKRGLYLHCKRLVDVAAAIALTLIVALPGALLVLLLIALGRRWPIVAEPRIGLGEERFDLYLLCARRPDGGEAGWRPAALAAAGVALRHTHADLIPALWNLLRGDLSLIGPRPERPEVVERMQYMMPLSVHRHRVHPGLVSLAQIRFRYTDAPRDTILALEYDIYYVKYRTARLDQYILLRAIRLLATDCARVAIAGAGVLHLSAARVAASLRRALPVRHALVASVALPEPTAAGATRLKPALIVGAGVGGKLLVGELRRNASTGLWPVAFVDDDRTKIGTRVEGLPVLGDTSGIEAIVRRERVETVVVAIPSAPEVEVKRIADAARRTDAEVLAMPNVREILRGRSGLALESVPMTDVLGRPVVQADDDRVRAFLAGRRVLVTGAAGSIGRELARQVAQSNAALVYGLDINESDLYDLAFEIGTLPGAAPFRPIVASVTNRAAIERTLARIRPDIVFHAAAYKHVPLMEEYPAEAVVANTLGTYHVACAAAITGVKRFVLVSTDKAVRPTSVMGATKRLAELAVHTIAAEHGLSACAVRFGNVLGSRGSVIPLFEKQIAAGGPVTVTHPEMKRYFMTITEAVGLIIQAGAFGHDGVLYILDMGEEVAIRELAERLIQLRGLRVGEDVAIVYTGMRPGEKLSESLALDFEAAHATAHPKIRILREGNRAAARSFDLDGLVSRLSAVAANGAPAEVRAAVMEAVAAADGGAATLSDAPRRSTVHRWHPASTVAESALALATSDG
jgi:FlaA1/EpsC-like NDP-sugar epimerase